MEIISPFTKEISGVSAFNYQQASVAGNMFFSVVSAFYASDGMVVGEKRCLAVSSHHNSFAEHTLSRFLPRNPPRSPTTDGIEEKTRWYDIELARFDQLVAFRKEYLDMLPSLNENWISGNSSLPSRVVIEKSKKLLDEFNSYLVRKSNSH